MAGDFFIDGAVTSRQRVVDDIPRILADARKAERRGLVVELEGARRHLKIIPAFNLKAISDQEKRILKLEQRLAAFDELEWINT